MICNVIVSRHVLPKLVPKKLSKFLRVAVLVWELIQYPIFLFIWSLTMCGLSLTTNTDRNFTLPE